MTKYIIRPYQAGFDTQQAFIGSLIASQWVWPFAYDLEDLLKIHGQPGFDPETHWFCFLEDEMVGYLTCQIMSKENPPTADLDFPRMLPGHEQAAMLLLERALDYLRNKKITQIFGRVSSMIPNEVTWAEKAGFVVKDWGYKVYYSYPMSQGKRSIKYGQVEEIDPETDLEACAALATHWYKRPDDWCLRQLQDWHQYGIISHLGIRSAGKWVASCLTARNLIQPSTAANYYIYSPDEDKLIPLLSAAINHCFDRGIENLIADLVNEQRSFEPVYLKLGFSKVAEWARCELNLAA